MNGIKKTVISICFSLLIPIMFLMGTCSIGWANHEASYQMKSNVGITFIEESGTEEERQENPEDSNSTTNAKPNKKTGTLPATGEQRTIIFSGVGMGICVAIWLYKRKKREQ
ncbi:LPXTG cell wall anchor domain-containing protein [Enterococcus faecalis]|nr:LPXTG cell wall anchor domain-containing protein [Enterococcus faecalis]EIT2197034.1 LPXTG cell wall anchor domain-containing protein [Enterococcus faecalis]